MRGEYHELSFRTFRRKLSEAGLLLAMTVHFFQAELELNSPSPSPTPRVSVIYHQVDFPFKPVSYCYLHVCVRVRVWLCVCAVFNSTNIRTITISRLQLLNCRVVVAAVVAFV